MLNRVDAAYSIISEAPQDPGDVAGAVRLSGRVVAPVKRMPVSKYGHMTGWTKGVVSVVGIKSLSIDYGGLTCVFTDLMEIEPVSGAAFSRKGDSGSLIVNGEGDAVGLLIGGAHAADGATKFSYANPFGLVLNELGVTLLH